MKNIVYGVVGVLLCVLVVKDCSRRNGKHKKAEITLESRSGLIEKQINNVGKLIVIEGNFKEIFTYNKSEVYFKDLLGDKLTFSKQLLAKVEAEASIAYDLRLLTYVIDEDRKVVQITSIPEEEVKKTFSVKFYEAGSSIGVSLSSQDYNKVYENVSFSLDSVINVSDFKKNAKNRLLTELSKIYILTDSLGWTLKYNETIIKNEKGLEKIKD